MYLSYDGLFFRVFCVTLIAIGFTFTVILTNVFIDIDGLLATKNTKDPTHVKQNDKINNEISFETKLIENRNKALLQEESNQENFYNEEQNFLDDFENKPDRTKRSIDNQNFLLHLQNPELRVMLTKRLTTLLEKMDNDEKSSEITNENTLDLNSIKQNEYEQAKHALNNLSVKYDEEDFNLLHLAMHNILLQGIINNMGINQFYRKMNKLVESINKADISDTVDIGNKVDISNKAIENKSARRSFDEKETIVKKEDTTAHKEQNRTDNDFSKKPRPDIKLDDNQNTTKVTTIPASNTSAPELFVKTSIDIISSKNLFNKSLSNVFGDLKLTFNGKAITLNHNNLNGDKKQNETELYVAKQTSSIITKTDFQEKNIFKSPKAIKQTINQGIDMNQLLNTNQHKTGNYLSQLVSKYIKDYENKSLHNSRESNNKERIKRDINKKKPPKEINVEDDLLIEVKTHFDPKGVKGQNKKKIIENIINKIQKAITPDILELRNISRGKSRKFHVKKRFQNSILHHTTPKNEEDTTDIIIPRELHPIDIITKTRTYGLLVRGDRGDGWKQFYSGPGYLSSSKAINSAEYAKVDADYKRVLKSNGVPQRYQVPIYTDASTEYNKADVSLINPRAQNDGHKYSREFEEKINSQSKEEVNFKIYSDLKDLSQEYAKNTRKETVTIYPKIHRSHKIMNRGSLDQQSKNHALIKRSTNTKKEDEYSSEHKFGYKDHPFPFNNYQDILEVNTGRDKIKNKNSDKTLIDDLPYLHDNDILTKKLNLSDIFGLAKYLDRTVRSLNFNSKMKAPMSTYINTRPKSFKKLFINSNRRNKREIDKIRIIAADDLSNVRRMMPNDNFFTITDDIFLSDNEDLKQHESEEIPEDEKLNVFPSYSYNYNKPSKINTSTHPFAMKVRQNALMDKYPHLFKVEASKSTEASEAIKDEDQIPSSKEGIHMPSEVVSLSKFIVPNSRNKILIQDMAKNKSQEAGFNEIHTSIHKSFNKNGLKYFQTVNLSAISNVENGSGHFQHPSPFHTNSLLVSQIKQQQEKIKDLINQHKNNIDMTLETLKAEHHKMENSSKVNNDKDKHKAVETLNDINKEQVLKIISDILAHNKIYRDNEKKATETTSKPNASTLNIDSTFTKVILHHIDKNTEMLRTFLEKLTNHDRATRKIFVVKDEDNKYNIKSETMPKYILNPNYPSDAVNMTIYHPNYNNQQPSKQHDIEYFNKNEIENVKSNSSGHFFLSPLDYEPPLKNPVPYHAANNQTVVNII